MFAPSSFGKPMGREPHSVLKTAPTVYPVALDEAERCRRITDSAEQLGLAERIAAATLFVERAAGQICLCTQTWTDLRTRFQSRMSFGRRPAASVTEVRYYDTDGTSQTVASSYWTTEFRTFFGYIELAASQSWPSIGGDRYYKVEIDYTVGFGGTADVPGNYKQAVLYLVGHYDEHREHIITGTIQSEIGDTVRAIVGQEEAFTF